MTKKQIVEIERRLRLRLRYRKNSDYATYLPERTSIDPVKVKTLPRWGVKNFKDQYPELYESELQYYHHKPCKICGKDTADGKFKDYYSCDKICKECKE